MRDEETTNIDKGGKGRKENMQTMEYQSNLKTYRVPKKIHVALLWKLKDALGGLLPVYCPLDFISNES